MSGYVNVSGLNSAYREAAVNEYQTYPDGLYQAEVVSAEFKNSKDGNSILYEWIFVILSGDYQDSRVRKGIVLKPKTMWILKADVHALGFESLKDADEIQNNQHRFIGIKVELRLETRTDKEGKSHPNIYINRRLNPHPGLASKEPPPPSDADAPF